MSVWCFGVCRPEQIAESVELFCLSSDTVDSASAADQQLEASDERADVESASTDQQLDTPPPPPPADDDEGSDRVDSAAAASECTAALDDDTTHRSTDVVSADEGDTSCKSNVLQDSLSGAKRLPKAAASILRRRDGGESRESLGSASGDEASDGGAAESPAAAGPGLMSRTLGSITALPGFFGKSSTDSATAQTPSSPRSAPDKSPNKTTRTFFFHRLVGRSAADSSEADATDDSRHPGDGNYR